MTSPDPNPNDVTKLTHARFDVVRVLGSGGMACVYEVRDRASERRLALKRLQPTSNEQRHRRLVELFEREFYTLSQLSHPAIVQAFDYGVDDGGPFYTMELLEGGELQSLAPLPYKQACKLFCTICSALSLLHSRRLVYRDLNPRNVRCDAFGAPKLIDFGAVAVMGPSPQVIGTPAYCAPEALDLQPLDARSDLFSLGATLYYALTGRHAFPAETFAQVRQLWDIGVTPPSAIVQGIPASLESLVMDLLKIDPTARPSNAGELMEQLAAIAGQTINENAGVLQAYLSTPTMVGREAQLKQLRAKLDDANAGHGAAVLITSASGTGRSRFLTAFQLEAKMTGALVVHASSRECTGEYGVVRALAHSLLDIAPELARKAAHEGGEILTQIVPRLVGASGEPPAKLPRAQVISAVYAWFSATSRERSLLLAIDDMHRSDELSTACLALLAHRCREHKLLIVGSCENGAHAALKLYESSATRIALENLTEAETVELLRSVFGSVPHVRGLGHKLYTVAAGNPRDTLRLAQTLVDRGAAKYHSGSWSLPAHVDADWLPQSMHQALLRELETLDPVARDLARLLSLADDRPLSFDECAIACAGYPLRSVHDALQQLLRTQFVKLEAEHYTIAHRGLHAALRSTVESETMRAAHARIADVLARRGDEPFRQAKHLLLSGDATRGVDALVAFAVTTQARTDSDPGEYVQLVLSMPGDWLDVFDHAIALCEELRRPRTEAFRLRNRLASLLNVMGATSHVHLLALIRQLCEDSGLDAYAALDPTLDPRERLKLALDEVKRRYEASAASERGLEPGVAIRYLVRALMLAAGMVALGLDYALWRALPSLAPLEPLSPAFGLMERLVGAVAARVTGRHEHARGVYTHILERLAQPDNGGLDASNLRFLRYGVMYGVALIEAGMGLASCLAWTQTLEGEPLHAVNALQVRFVYELWMGRVREAEQVRELAELKRIESGARQMADGSHLIWQTLAHAYSDDLMRLKQVIDDLRALAQRHAAWAAIVHYAHAEYQRLRGDHVQALEHLQSALEGARAGSHQIWPHAAAAQIRALDALARFEEAVAVGEQHLQAAARTDVGYFAGYIRMPLAIACARLDQHARALQLAEEARHGFESIGTSGLNLALVYETCCRVARITGHQDEFLQYAERCADVCRDMNAQALRARMERLIHEGSPGAFASLTPVLVDSAENAFDGCDDARERAERTLQLLLSQSQVHAGALYLVGRHGLALAAQVGPSPAPELTARVQTLVDTELRQGDLATISLATEASENAALVCGHSLLLLCHQSSRGLIVTGVAALAPLPGRRFIRPGALAVRLSRMLMEWGDVVPLGDKA